jgi:leucyl aminopeptidase
MSVKTVSSTLETVALSQLDTPLLAVALAQGSDVPGSLAELDKAASGLVGRAITSGDFKGKRDETSLLYPPTGKTQRILLVGLGKVSDVTRNAIRRAAAGSARRGSTSPWRPKRAPG